MHGATIKIISTRILTGLILMLQLLFYYYLYSAFGLVWAGTRAQSDDRCGSGTLHPGQVLRVVCHCFPPLQLYETQIQRKESFYE